MESWNPFSAFPAAPPRPVDVSQIERELSCLWKSAADGPEGHPSGAGAAVTRACSLNLVIFCESQAVAARANEAVAAIIPQHPCRALLLLADPAAPNPQMEAWISAHCFLPGSGGPQICCEQISIRAAGKSVMHLPEALRPLLAPDLPVVLWWPTVPAWDDPLSQALHQEADQIILDTGRLGASDPKFQGLKGARGDSGRVVISDLNWLRLLPWRELTAQFFDPLDFRLYLDRLDGTVIEWVAGVEGSAPASGAVLMAAWLASRLGWTWLGRQASEEEETLFFQREGTKIDVALRSQWNPSLSPGEIAGLRLIAGQADPPATFLLRMASPGLVLSTVEVPAACPLPRMIGLDRHDEAHLLCGALEEVGRDRVYEAALELACQMYAEAASAAGSRGSLSPSTRRSP